MHYFFYKIKDKTLTFFNRRSPTRFYAALLLDNVSYWLRSSFTSLPFSSSIGDAVRDWVIEFSKIQPSSCIGTSDSKERVRGCSNTLLLGETPLGEALSCCCGILQS